MNTPIVVYQPIVILVLDMFAFSRTILIWSQMRRIFALCFSFNFFFINKPKEKKNEKEITNWRFLLPKKKLKQNKTSINFDFTDTTKFCIFWFLFLCILFFPLFRTNFPGCCCFRWFYCNRCYFPNTNVINNFLLSFFSFKILFCRQYFCWNERKLLLLWLI